MATVIKAGLSAEGLANTRFALSPAMELDGLLRALTRTGNTGGASDWVEPLRPRLRGLRGGTDLDAVLALQGPRDGVEFLVPPPVNTEQTFQDDLATIRSTPAAVARAEIAVYLARRTDLHPATVAVLTAPDAVERLASALSAAWDVLMQPHWPLVQTICQRDVAYRADRLSRHGFADAVTDLHPRLRWDGMALTIRLEQVTANDVGTDGDTVEEGVDDEDMTVLPRGAAGLLLVPSVFLPSSLVLLDDPSWPAALVYPARGSAALRGTSHVDLRRNQGSRRAGQVSTSDVSAADRVPAALAALLGRSRAAILLALTAPGSTTQLARTLRLSTGTVGDHLAVLHRSGLVTPARAGRSVLYRLTPVAEAVLSATQLEEPPVQSR